MHTIRTFTKHFSLYQLINVSAFIFDLLLLQLLLQILSIQFAVVTSFLIASSISFLLNHTITFHDSRRTLIRGYIYFLGFAILRGLVLAGGITILLNYEIITLLSARIFVGAFVGVLGFFLDYLITFNMHKTNSR